MELFYHCSTRYKACHSKIKLYGSNDSNEFLLTSGMVGGNSQVLGIINIQQLGLWSILKTTIYVYMLEPINDKNYCFTREFSLKYQEGFIQKIFCPKNSN